MQLKLNPIMLVLGSLAAGIWLLRSPARNPQVHLVAEYVGVASIGVLSLLSGAEEDD